MLHEQKFGTSSDNSMINENTVCLPLKLIPSVNWFASGVGKTELLINTNEFYRKGFHPNRYTIPAANGIINLSTPLAGGRNQKIKLSELKIAGDDWKRNHLHAIQSAYGKSAYFLYYKDELENIINDSGNSFFDLSVTAIKWLSKELIPEVAVVIAELEMTESEINLINKHEADIQKKYHQVFENKFGFQKNMSAIDLLFCLGPEGKKFLKEN